MSVLARSSLLRSSERPRKKSPGIIREDQTISLAYLTSGTGGRAENSRSNVARSELARSETAM
jgi:hypothetical protein